jgi:hypothetical protein
VRVGVSHTEINLTLYFYKRLFGENKTAFRATETAFYFSKTAFHFAQTVFDKKIKSVRHAQTAYYFRIKA